MDNNSHWVGTWAASPAPSEAGVGFNNHTLRMNPRVSIGGDTLRGECGRYSQERSETR